MPLDNPLGLVDAILASATPRELDGRVFGGKALRQDAAWQAALAGRAGGPSTHWVDLK